MVQHLGIGIGAGLVSALLFGVLLKATPLAIILYLLAPLPILIVGLGWSSRAALIAVVTGALALALVISPFLGLGFAAYLGVPAWWLAHLAMLGRPNPDGTLEWYPTGRLLGWTAGTAALAFVAIAVIAAPSYDAFATQLRTMTATVVRIQSGKPAPAPKAETGAPAPQAEGSTPDPSPAKPPAQTSGDDTQSEVADALAKVAPALATQGLSLLLTLYLWAAARIVKISGRLPRPWPDIPSTQMPRAVIALLGLSVLLGFGPGYVGVLGVALAGSLSAAFALQGLAAFHDRSRGKSGRGALLFGLYLILFVTQGIALFALTLFGIADTALDRRRPRDGRPS